MKHELAAARREIALHGLVSDHPSVVTVRDAYEDDDYFYLIMDFCRTGDLFEPICRRVYVDNDALVRKAFISLIDAVEACHSLRIYHRDLKPENILLDSAGALKISDFGLSAVYKLKDTGRTRMLTERCGSLPYVAPELANEEPYSAEPVDVWGCGVILFTLLVGSAYSFVRSSSAQLSL